MIDRRAFLGTLAGGLLAAPLASWAQQSPRVWRIGALDLADSRGWAGFREGLRDLGREDGRSVAIEFRWSSGQAKLLQELAAELVRINADVLVTGNWESTKAAKEATSTIPIVMLGVTDPPAASLVGRFDRPAGNVTGISYQPTALITESVGILREVRPGVSRVALLYDPRVWAASVGRQRLEVIASRAGMTLLPLAVSGRDDIEIAFAALTLERPDAIIVDVSGPLSQEPGRVAQFAIKHGFPGISGSRTLADEGFLVSHGPALFAMGRRAAHYVNEILKGTKLVDLPVEQFTKFELVINLKTAKALGLTIPPSLLQRADHVIE